MVRKESLVFDTKTVLSHDDANGAKDSIAGVYVVQRISFGVIELNESTVSISFIAEKVEDEESLIGVDQFMLTRQEK